MRPEEGEGMGDLRTVQQRCDPIPQGVHSAVDPSACRHRISLRLVVPGFLERKPERRP